MSKISQKRILNIEITRHDGAAPIVAGQLSLDGEYFVFLDAARQVTVCHIDTGEWQALPISQPANAIAVSPIDREVCVALAGGNVERFDLTLPHLKLSTLSTRPANRLVYDEQGCLLAVAEGNGCVSLFELHAVPFCKKLIEHRIDSGPLAAINLNRDKLFGVSSKGRLFVLRQPDAFTPEIEWNGSVDSEWDCYSIANHTFLANVAAAGYGGYVRLYKGYCTRPLFIDSGFKYVHQVQFLSESGQLVMVGNSGVAVWDIQSMCHDFSWKVPHGKVFCARQTDDDLLVIWG